MLRTLQRTSYILLPAFQTLFLFPSYSRLPPCPLKNRNAPSTPCTPIPSFSCPTPHFLAASSIPAAIPAPFSFPRQMFRSDSLSFYRCTRSNTLKGFPGHWQSRPLLLRFLPGTRLPILPCWYRKARCLSSQGLSMCRKFRHGSSSHRFLAVLPVLLVPRYFFQHHPMPSIPRLHSKPATLKPLFGIHSFITAIGIRTTHQIAYKSFQQFSNGKTMRPCFLRQTLHISVGQLNLQRSRLDGFYFFILLFAMYRKHYNAPLLLTST